MGIVSNGVVQRFFRLGNNTDGVPMRITELGSLAVAEVEMPGTEILRAGRRYSAGHINGATFQAQQTAIPTTTAGLLIYNGESGSNPKSYAIQQMLAYEAGGTTATGMMTLFAAILRPGAADFTVPTAVVAGTAICSLSGKSPASLAKTALAATVANNGQSSWNWTPVATGSGAALWSGVVTSQSESLMLVPPGGALALAVVSAAGTTPTFGLSAIWDELELDTE